MAGFRMHVSTSAVLGCGYAGVGHALYGVPLDTAVVAGAMCGFSGMLPDLDSDYGVPLRETMAFTAAIIPMMLVGRFQSLALSHDAMALAAVSLYLFVRFGVTNIVRKYTVHRGMFHSIPACLIFAGLAFLVTGTAPFEIRCYKAGGVVAGFMSHLLLDEIYAIEWKGGRWRFKKSFGTALKLWGDDGWSNFSTYAKLAIVVMFILGEPTVMEHIESRHPQFANQIDDVRNRLNQFNPAPATQNALDAARTAIAPFNKGGTRSPPTGVAPTDPFQLSSPGSPYRNEIDTAQRAQGVYPQ
ncbi:MAG: metal-dependent hydrolase [Planctomycetes bacterium]|nr:metal-dependent hydrolase [Planctomycetota bacterium]